jgi:hypothetical protein
MGRHVSVEQKTTPCIMRKRSELTRTLHLIWVGCLGNEKETSQPLYISSSCCQKLSKYDDDDLPCRYALLIYKCVLLSPVVSSDYENRL